MTIDQKTQIATLRVEGISYRKIGEMLGLPCSTVKTHCRRKGIKPKATSREDIHNLMFCRECCKPLTQVAGQRRRFFCCANCRVKWWHEHPEQIKQKAIYSYQCAACGKMFTAYGNSHRKYCSHTCYINARFKSGDSHEQSRV